jgi:hypothetical protein
MRKFALFGLIFFQVLACAALETAQAATALTVEDCRKCHTHEYQQIASRGMAHKDKMTCLGCHESHRPRSAENIPACSGCHGRVPHEDMIDCSSCHERKENCTACHQAHQPLARTNGKTALIHCMACHHGAYDLLNVNTTKHHDLSCAFCHTVHREIRDCSDCHGRPHPEGTHKMFRCSDCHGIAHDLGEMPKKSS